MAPQSIGDRRSMNEFDDKLIEVIEQNGMLEPVELDRAKTLCKEQEKDLERILIDSEMLNSEQVLWVKSQVWQVPLICVDPEAIDPDLLASFPSALLWEGEALPLLKFEDEISVAMTDPSRQDVIDDLEKISSCKVQISLARPDHIKNILKAMMDSECEEDKTTQITIDPTAFGTDDESGVAIIFYNLMRAVQKKATEVLFRPSDQGVNIHFRIGRKLSFSETAPPERTGSIMSKLQVMAHLDDSKEKLLETQTLTLELFCQKYHLDFMSLPSRAGKAIKVAIRPFQPAMSKNLPDLSPKDAAVLLSAMKAKSGLLLVNTTDRELAISALSLLLDKNEEEIITLLIGDDKLIGSNDVVVVPPEKLTDSGADSLVFTLNKVNPDVAIVDFAAIPGMTIPTSWIFSGRLMILLLPFDCALNGLLKVQAIVGDGTALAAGFAGSLAMKTFSKLDESNRSPVELTEKETKFLKNLEVKPEGSSFYAATGANPTPKSVTFYELIPPDEGVLEILRDAPSPGKLYSLLQKKGYRKIVADAAKAAGEGIISLYDVLRY